MSAINPVFYFCLFPLFLLEAWLLSILLPFHRRVNHHELQSQRLFPLDGLRGLLALSVFFSHAASYYFYDRTNLWDYPPSNFYSQMAVLPVTMFFFITAYLFWSKLAKNPSQLKWRFLRGRLARLAPTYIGACCLLFLLTAYFSDFHIQIPPWKLGLQALSWLLFWGGQNINGVNDSRLWLGAAWTLRYEWLFYLSLPFLGWFARRKRNALWLIGIVAVIGFTAEQLGSVGRFGAPLRLFASYARFLAFTFSGGIVVSLLPHKTLRTWGRGVTATVLSFITLGCVLFIVPPAYGFLESAFLAFPFACVCLGNSWFGLLSSRPLLFLGRVSYSFYLLHVLALSVILLTLKKHGMLDGISPIYHWAIATVCGMVTIVVCAFSYQFLEAPFLHLGKVSRDTGTGQRSVGDNNESASI